MLMLLACLTLTDVRQAECNVACKNWGYDLGRYEDGSCLCIIKRDWADTQEKRVTLPQRTKKVER